jgi:hypothetical protein
LPERSTGRRDDAGVQCALAGCLFQLLAGCTVEPAPTLASEAPEAADTNPLAAEFALAREVTVGDPDGAVKSIDVFEQHDFFRFRGVAGGYYEIRTARKAFMPDTTITLYDAAGRQLAFNDEGFLWFMDEIDARIVIRLADHGDYYAKVADIETPEEFFESYEAGWSPGLYYRLVVRELGAANDVAYEYGNHSALDYATPAALVQPAGQSQRQVTLLGEFEQVLDMDMFEFDGLGDSVLLGRVHRSGEQGNGSTALDRLVWVSDSSRATLAEISPAAGQYKLSPPVGADHYTLSLVSDNEQVGDNDFYAVDLVMVPDNPSELDDAHNGSLERAEALTVDVGGYRSRGYVLARLPEHDVDYFSFEALPGETLAVTCNASSEGSGLVDLRAELRGPDDTLLAHALESATEALEIAEAPVARAGTHYLRLSSGLQRWGLEGDWARCVLTITHF